MSSSAGTAVVESIDPANGEVVERYELFTEAQIDEALALFARVGRELGVIGESGRAPEFGFQASGAVGARPYAMGGRR